MPQSTQRKDVVAQKQQEKESKRARGALSCAECRRLKLKCDKTVPCSSCRRRGCSAICPNGSLITGQGTRFVLADTDKLHAKIAEMSDRIRQLEAALSILHSASTTASGEGGATGKTHPLLERHLLEIKSSLELHSASDGALSIGGVGGGGVGGSGGAGGGIGGSDNRTGAGAGEREEESDDEEKYIDAFGTLAIRDDGAATFYGRSAGSESLLIGEAAKGVQPDSSSGLANETTSNPTVATSLDITSPNGSRSSTSPSSSTNSSLSTPLVYSAVGGYLSPPVALGISDSGMHVHMHDESHSEMYYNLGPSTTTRDLPRAYAHITSSFPFGSTSTSPLLSVPNFIAPHISSHFNTTPQTQTQYQTQKPTLQSLIAHFLPPYDEATRLCGLYLQQAPWFFGAVREEQIVGEMLPMWYGVGVADSFGGSQGVGAGASSGAGGMGSPSGGGGVGGNSNGNANGGTSHDLALLFMIFCYGHTTDVNLPAPPENVPADKYYQLAKVALTVDTRECGFGSLISGYAGGDGRSPTSNSPTTNGTPSPSKTTPTPSSSNGLLDRPPSVSTVQTLSLMAVYEGICSHENSIETTWTLMGLASKLAQSIGLHRDSARWKLPNVEVQKRRAFFWELFITDCWMSLATGRLPTFSLPFVDCELPFDTGQTLDEDGNSQPSFPHWKARFGYECVSAVAQATLTSRAPKFSIIVELDRRVRDVRLPGYARGGGGAGRGGGSGGDGGGGGERGNRGESTDIGVNGNGNEKGLAETMEQFMPGNYRELTLLYIHRCFFAHAIASSPLDPIKSQYAPSFLAGYVSARNILDGVKEQFGMFPRQIARFWVLWTHAFSASVMIASIATHASRSPAAPAAMLQLKDACDLFEAAAPYGGRAGKFLPILRRLQTKAQNAFREANGNTNGISRTIRVEEKESRERELKKNVKEREHSSQSPSTSSNGYGYGYPHPLPHPPHPPTQVENLNRNQLPGLSDIFTPTPARSTLGEEEVKDELEIFSGKTSRVNYRVDLRERVDMRERIDTRGSGKAKVGGDLQTGQMEMGGMQGQGHGDSQGDWYPHPHPYSPNAHPGSHPNSNPEQPPPTSQPEPEPQRIDHAHFGPQVQFQSVGVGTGVHLHASLLSEFEMFEGYVSERARSAFRDGGLRRAVFGDAGGGVGAGRMVVDGEEEGNGMDVSVHPREMQVGLPTEGVYGGPEGGHEYPSERTEDSQSQSPSAYSNSSQTGRPVEEDPNSHPHPHSQSYSHSHSYAHRREGEQQRVYNGLHHGQRYYEQQQSPHAEPESRARESPPQSYPYPYGSLQTPQGQQNSQQPHLPQHSDSYIESHPHPHPRSILQAYETPYHPQSHPQHHVQPHPHVQPQVHSQPQPHSYPQSYTTRLEPVQVDGLGDTYRPTRNHDPDPDHAVSRHSESQRETHRTRMEYYEHEGVGMSPPALPTSTHSHAHPQAQRPHPHPHAHSHTETHHPPHLPTTRTTEIGHYYHDHPPLAHPPLPAPSETYTHPPPHPHGYTYTYVADDPRLQETWASYMSGVGVPGIQVPLVQGGAGAPATYGYGQGQVQGPGGGHGRESQSHIRRV